MKYALLAAVLLAVFGLATVPGVQAQGDIVVESSNAENDFPNGVKFALLFHGDSDVADLKVTLHYIIPPEGAATYEEPKCNGDTTLECTYTLKSDPKLFLVPGANVKYYWEIVDSAGSIVKTPQETFVYEDTRFEWKSITDDSVTVWHYGSDSKARSLLQTGVDGLQGMERLLGTQVAFPVKVFLYETAEDMQPAALSNESQDEGVITLGEVLFSDTAVVSQDTDPEDVMRHEIAHIVVRQAVKGPFGNLPAWLNEGTATYAQSELLSNEKHALSSAIESGDVLSVRAMSSASLGHTSVNVSLFYGQSWSLVSFLIDDYGEAKFAELFSTFKAGSTVDKAFQKVYGFDLDGLENAWRESVGLPAKEASGQQGQTTPAPQLTPFEGSGGNSGEQEKAKDAGGLPVTIIAGAVAAAAALVVVVVVRRRRRKD